VCGRYTLSTVDGPDIAQRFGLITPPEQETLGRFNVCPTETIAAVLTPAEAAAVPWGLRPFKSQNYAPINVRSETAGSRFKRLLAGGRCLVLADGWYEWLKAERKGQPRLPFRYTVDGGEPFAFAGLFDGTGAAILTTQANEICAPIHDRMPVVLGDREAEAAWLSDDVDAEAALEFLRPLESARVSVAPANPAVNRAGVEGEELLIPPEQPLAQQSDTLF
jgi:putative SOS response-associated peptidase YedK